MWSKFKPFLIAAVVGVLMSSGCSTTPTVRVFQQPPSACLQSCEMPPAPNLGGQGLRNEWEHRTLEAFGACYALHETCVVESLKRLEKE